MSKHTKHNPDYTKNKDADVIKKGSGPAIPQEHWQVNKDLTPQGNDRIGADAFNPRPGKMMPRTHVKTNECDY